MDDNAFERYFRSGKTAINIAEAAQYSLEIQNELIRSHNPWDNSDIKAAFEKKYGASEFSLQGIPRIVKGNEPTVAITHDQFHAIEAIFGIKATDTMLNKIEVIIGTTSSNQNERAKLMWIHARSPLDQIIISQGLAKLLKLKADEEIKIIEIEENINDIDLDRLR